MIQAGRMMMVADRLRIAVKGRGCHRFLTAASAQGIKLHAVRCCGDGYNADVAGGDLARLRSLADAGGWQLQLVRRQGPGRWLERGMRRPGIAVGVLLFLVLVKWLSGYVWHIDFGNLEQAKIADFRQVLEEQGVREGTYMTQDLLHRTQYALLQQSDDFGWLGLNFAGGCLFVEQTVNQTQTVQDLEGEVGLYAKADGLVVALRLQSGFAQVNAGQYVAEGQLLANGQRADRDGDAVTQSARGQVVARVQKTYTASQPLRVEAQVLTGQSTKQDTWYCLGRSFSLNRSSSQSEPYEQALQTVEWLPLSIGQVSLPGCIYRQTAWETKPACLVYSAACAQAMARRQCRLDLLREFPDADIESEQVTPLYTEQAVECEVCFVFTADIAQEGPLMPLEQVRTEQ